MRKSSIKILSILFVCYFLLSSLTVLSFGATNLAPTSIYSWNYYQLGTVTPSIVSYGDTGAHFTFTNANTSNCGYFKYFSLSDYDVSHEYTLTFEYYGTFNYVHMLPYLILDSDFNTTDAITFQSIKSSNDSQWHTVSYKFTPNKIYNGTVSSFWLGFLFYSESSSNVTANLYIRNVVLVDSDKTSGFWNTLFGWLSDIKNSIVNALSGLGSTIRDKFNALTTSIGGFFTDLWDDLSNAFDNIGQWFVDLGDSISDLFDTITDYILYFEHPVELDSNGVPVDQYGEPIYENVFDIPDFFDTLDGWVDNLDNAKTDVQTGANTGVQAFQNTIAPLTSILNRVPFLTIFITFALAIIVIKKVIG